MQRYQIFHHYQFVEVPRFERRARIKKVLVQAEKVPWPEKEELLRVLFPDILPSSSEEELVAEPWDDAYAPTVVKCSPPISREMLLENKRLYVSVVSREIIFLG